MATLTRITGGNEMKLETRQAIFKLEHKKICHVEIPDSEGNNLSKIGRAYICTTCQYKLEVVSFE